MENAVLNFGKSPPMSADVTVADQTSPGLSDKPCKFRLLSIRSPFALFRSLAAFKMYFKGTPVLNLKGASVGKRLLFLQKSSTLTMTGRLSEETFALI